MSHFSLKIKLYWIYACFNTILLLSYLLEFNLILFHQNVRVSDYLSPKRQRKMDVGDDDKIVFFLLTTLYELW